MVDPTDKDTKHIKDRNTGTERYLEYTKEKEKGKVNQLDVGSKNYQQNSGSNNPRTSKNSKNKTIWTTFGFVLSCFYLSLDCYYNCFVGLFCSPHQVGLPCFFPHNCFVNKGICVTNEHLQPSVINLFLIKFRVFLLFQAMTQTHPFLDTIGSTDREITGYYSDSEQLYR